VRQVLPGGELVVADAFDEVGVGVDDGDQDVPPVEPAGEAAGGVGAGVAGAEDDDAVLHDPLLSVGSRPEPDGAAIPDRFRW
jgi:hypothetical protein